MTSSGRSPTVLVSLDGIAPRFITPERMPSLCDLARSGSACFHARTVEPPWTRAVHATMLRGVDPAVHGLVDNSMAPLQTDSPSVLAVARAAGLTTASMNNWLQMDSLIEDQASTYRYFIDSGYDPAEDDVMVDAVASLWNRTVPDLTYVYLCRPDLAGHDHGWGSPEYLHALEEVDRCFGRLLDAVGPDANVVVTTDHGGVGTDHASTHDDVMNTFVVVRSDRLEAGTFWTTSSVLDIAPTVADLCGLSADAQWQGSSLLGREEPVLDYIIGLLEKSDKHSYGEDLSMLEHALQAATQIATDGGDDDLVLAGLLHDLGHMMGPAGPHGIPGHAVLGARWLQPWLPAPVVEPIRLHVDAKRHLVGTDPQYASRLSAASVATLAHQGGPLSREESAAFVAEPHAERALQLRRCDDLGKVAGLEVGTLADFKERITRGLRAGPLDPAWARAACRCDECRDPSSDQHLIGSDDILGWTVLGMRRTEMLVHVDLRRGAELHEAVIPTGRTQAERPLLSYDLAARNHTDVDSIARDVVDHGIALVSDVPIVEGQVLRFAETLGFVRETNYGRLFDVRTEPRPTNLAYSPVALPLHTDNPYRDPRPTVQILHCLQPAIHGGATRLADGFAAVAKLRATDPQSFEVLSTEVVTFRYHDAGCDLQARRPIIEVRPDGSIRSIAVNNRSLDSAGSTRFHRALQQLVRHLDNEVIELTLAAGQAIVFDNRRVLHARTGFDPTSGRHLQGCYIDIDALQSIAHTSPVLQ